jgi:hypothetical protein
VKTENFDSNPREELVTTRVLSALIGATCVAQAILAHGGTYSPLAMLWMTLAGAGFIAAIWAPPIPRISLRIVTFVALAIALWFVALTASDWFPRARTVLLAIVVIGIGVGWARLSSTKARAPKPSSTNELTAKSRFSPRVWKGLFVALLLIQTVGCGVRLQRSQLAEKSMRFGVIHDVQIVNQRGVRALMEGRNPYSGQTPNVMGSDAPYYPPNSSDQNGMLPFGFLYTPESLFFLLPGEALFGDFRWMHLLALSGAAWLLFAARPSPLSFGAASVLLWFPANPAILNLSWTEPMAAFFLALTLWCFYRAPRAWPFALGLLFGAKQYTVFLLPLVMLLEPSAKERRVVLMKSLAVTLGIALPFVVWDFASFWRSAVWMQVKQPFPLRFDVVSGCDLERDGDSAFVDAGFRGVGNHARIGTTFRAAHAERFLFRRRADVLGVFRLEQTSVRQLRVLDIRAGVRWRGRGFASIFRR